MALIPRKRVLVFAFGATVTVAVVAHLRAAKRRSEAAAAAFAPSAAGNPGASAPGAGVTEVVEPVAAADVLSAIAEVVDVPAVDAPADVELEDEAEGPALERDAALPRALEPAQNTDDADPRALEPALGTDAVAPTEHEVESWAWVAAGDTQLSDEDHVEEPKAEEVADEPAIAAMASDAAGAPQVVAAASARVEPDARAIEDAEAGEGATHAGPRRRASDFDPLAAEDSAYDGPARRASDAATDRDAQLLAAAIAEQHAAEDARREERESRAPRPLTADRPKVEVVVLTGPLAEDV